MSKKKEKKKSYIKGKLNTWLKSADTDGDAIYSKWKKRMYHYAQREESSTDE